MEGKHTFLALLGCILIAQASAADDVVVGTSKNFETLVKDNSFVVAEFYAPWCGHCKKLEPEYVKAAKELKSHDPPIVLVKVDATQDDNKELASKYSVQGYPTLLIFRDGNVENPQEYKGPRDSSGMVAYLKKKTLPASSPLETANEVKAFKEYDPAVVGVFDKLEGPEFEVFLSVAGGLSDDLTFAHTTTKILSGKAPSVKLFKKSEGKELTYTEKFEISELQEWLEAQAAPLLLDLDDQRNQGAVNKAFGSSNPRFFSIFEKGSKVDKELRPALNVLAESLLGEAHFINIDPANQQALEFFGIKKEEVPAFAIQSNKDKYILGSATAKKLSKFWKDFKAGKLTKAVKSAEPPADNTKPVTIATGRTLEEIAFSGKTVLLEFYAPWCGHCKKLDPIYEEVGKEFAKDDNIVIAKMDATANDVSSEEFEVGGFPTLYLVKKDKEVVKYEGDRSKADLIKFVKKHAGATSSTDDSPDDHSEL